MTMLDAIVDDWRLAWVRSDLDLSDVTVAPSGRMLAELRRRRALLRRPTTAVGEERALAAAFPVTVAETRALAWRRLEQGPGVAVLEGSAFREFDEPERRSIFRIACRALGRIRAQDAAGTAYATVMDLGARLADGGRYHQSNESGVLHTDGPQLASPPDYVGLLCVHPARTGGETRLVSVYSVHNAFLTARPDALALLYDRFAFERRGLESADTIRAPVFAYRHGRRLRFRYLGQYVRSGHEVARSPLSVEHRQALDLLDGYLGREDLTLSVALAAGDILWFDNRRVAHGRTAFHDDAGVRRRELERIWIARRRGSRRDRALPG
jgi:alpha-ketoglutarate-dependent taurine dioxygenase